MVHSTREGYGHGHQSYYLATIRAGAMYSSPYLCCAYTREEARVHRSRKPKSTFLRIRYARNKTFYVKYRSDQLHAQSSTITLFTWGGSTRGPTHHRAVSYTFNWRYGDAGDLTEVKCGAGCPTLSRPGSLATTRAGAVLCIT